MSWGANVGGREERSKWKAKKKRGRGNIFLGARDQRGKGLFAKGTEEIEGGETICFVTIAQI